ncbi:tRNA (guanine(46)-N(7))-methyltransferase TrmB [Roseomonas sp. BN140053]|uniref:tRNA (guanine(46)-N(7))-methyltransferase TrmB n=1 Tax=Roseomonas sp. BN140053 TaxID=3391898 RepID=UPI0039EB9D2A
MTAERPGTAPDRPPAPVEGVPDRLYGRRRGHPLRARQQALLDAALPRLSLRPEQLGDPAAAFTIRPEQVWLEIGFGGGEHADALARAHPGVGLIASEVFENGICSLLSRLVPEGEEATGPGLPNLRFWTRDARHLLAALPAGALSRLYLMFPDPWPKARHSKRRFVHPATLPLVARALPSGGEWRIASDHPVYQAWVEEVMAAQALFDPALDTTERPADWFPTRYEGKAHREGRTPRYWIWRRR